MDDHYSESFPDPNELPGFPASSSTASSGGMSMYESGESGHRSHKPKKQKLSQAQSDEEEEEVDDEEADVKDKGKGSKGGSSCHQCKSRRNFTALTYCTSNLDKKNKKCRKKFCGHCLKKFYKESPAMIPDKNNWKCPSCRKICCCAACRRRKQKDGADDDSYAVSPKHTSSGYGHDEYGGQSSSLLSNELSSPLSTPLMIPGGYELLPEQLSLSHDSELGFPSNKRSRAGAGGHAHGASSSSAAGGGESDDSDSSDSSDDGNDAMDASGGGGGGGGGGVGSGSDAPVLAQIGSNQFYSQLSQYIKTLAAEARRDPSTPFSRLYRQAQSPAVKRKIAALLARTDLKKEKKVDLIAAILQPLQI